MIFTSTGKEYSHIDPRIQRTPTIEFKIEFSYKRLFISKFMNYIIACPLANCNHSSCCIPRLQLI